MWERHSTVRARTHTDAPYLCPVCLPFQDKCRAILENVYNKSETATRQLSECRGECTEQMSQFRVQISARQNPRGHIGLLVSSLNSPAVPPLVPMQ